MASGGDDWTVATLRMDASKLRVDKIVRHVRDYIFEQLMENSKPSFCITSARLYKGASKAERLSITQILAKKGVTVEPADDNGFITISW